MNYVWIKGFVRSWLIGVVGLMAGSALAANLTWTGGAGATWDTTSNNWSGATQETPWDSTNGKSNVAYFTTEGASPSVSATVYLSGVRFSNTTTVAGSGTLYFLYTSGENSITATSNVTFNANYYRNASGNIAIYGPGKITFNGVSSIVGQFYLNSGEMVISATGAHTNINITSVQAGSTMRVYGLLRMNGENTDTAGIAGQFVQEGGIVTTVNVNGPFRIYSGGSYSLNNGSLSVASVAKVGTSSAGTFTQSGGTNTLSKDLYLAESSTANGQYNMLGGRLNAVSATLGTIYAGVGGSGSGTLTISNSSAIANCRKLVLGNSGSVTGTVNLCAGALRVTGLYKGASTSPQTFNFSGGTLAPYNANATIGHATAANNNTITLTGTNATISSEDKDATKRTVNIYSKLTGDGAITFTGAGTNIVISAENDYTGSTTVNGGTVVWSNACLCVTNDLICTNSPVLKLDFADTNTINRLIVNGQTQPPDIYKSANAPAGMTIEGNGALNVTYSSSSGGTIYCVH